MVPIINVLEKEMRKINSSSQEWNFQIRSTTGIFLDHIMFFPYFYFIVVVMPNSQF